MNTPESTSPDDAGAPNTPSGYPSDPQALNGPQGQNPQSLLDTGYCDSPSEHDSEVGDE